MSYCRERSSTLEMRMATTRSSPAANICVRIRLALGGN
jgi:hypothetical protein